MKRRLFTAATGLIVLTLVVGANGCNRFERHTLAVDGLQRTYFMHVPESAKGAPAPAVIALHGGGGKAFSFARGFDLRELASENGFIAVYPDALDRGWNDGREFPTASRTDDMGFLDALIDTLIAEHNVDPDRVYLTGVSNGGMMTYAYACARAERLAAVAPVAQSLSESFVPSCMPSVPLPICIINGTEDALVPYEGGPIMVLGTERGNVLSTMDTLAYWADANGCSGTLAFEEWPDRDPNDGTRITRFEYTGCGDAPAVLYEVEGGGHTWPGAPPLHVPELLLGTVSRDADGLELIWDFFSRHSRE